MRIPLRNVPDMGLLPVKLPGGAHVVVIRRGDLVTALEDECPHQGMPLSAGVLKPDGTLECPFHGARFDCATGACVRGPGEDAVATWAVALDGADIVIGGRRP